MKISDTLIWIWDSYLSDPQVQEAIKGFGGICAFGVNGLALAKNYPELNNLYNFVNPYPLITNFEYLGEYGTRRQYIPIQSTYSNIYADESSPYRLAITSQLPIPGLGYSSYRTTLFTVPTVKTDWNIRLPILSPLWTLNRLNNKYGARHRFVWLDLKKNLYFCSPYKALLNPGDTVKQWSFKPISIFGWKFKIPFDWHIRRMIRFADKYGKRLFIYAGDYDVSNAEVLERIAIIKKYLN